MQKKIISFLLFTYSIFSSSLGVAGTYNIFLEIGESTEITTVSGSISTDGTLGMLQTHNVLSWSINMFDSSNGIDFSFDSTNPNSFFEIDYAPPDNLGPTATPSAIEVTFGEFSGTEMQFQYFQASDPFVLYEVTFGTDWILAMAQTDEIDAFYVNNYFDTGESMNLEIGLISTENNISAVPVPATVWLFGSGIAGFAGFRRFKKKEA